MSAGSGRGWARHLTLGILAGLWAAVILALWDAESMLLASPVYRQEPGRLADLLLTALLWQVPLLAGAGLALALALGAAGRRMRVPDATGLCIGLGVAFLGLGTFFGTSEKALSLDRATITALLLLSAAAFAAGLGAARLVRSALESERIALALRSGLALLTAAVAALSIWSLLREALQFSVVSVAGIASAAGALLAGLAAGAVVHALSGAGLRAWARTAAVAGAVLAAGLGVARIPLAAILAPAEASAAPGAHPNVILIVADTLRRDRVGAYGARRARTPAIDALASAGSRVETVAATASWTIPATTSILTGLYPSSHGLRSYRDKLRPDAVSLGAILERAGYETAGFLANPVLSSGFDLDRGFETWKNRPGLSRVSRHRRSALARALASLGLWAPETTFSRAADVVDAAGRWLRGQGDRPYLLYLHFMDPHDPYTPPAPWDTAYDGGEGGPLEMGFGTLPRIMAATRQVGPGDLASMVALYEGEVSYMDEQIGRFLDEARGAGRLENTLVVFVSDHGEEFIEHGGLGHEHTLYEELVSVPLILSGPGIPAGSVLSGPTSQADIAPTILEAVGVPSPVPMEGISLWGALSRGEPLPERDLFMEEVYIGQRSPVHFMKAVRRGDLKLIGSSFHARGEGPWRWELYDLEGDPGESINLAGHRPEEVAVLREALEIHESRPRAGRSEMDEADEDRMELLKSLGYVE